MRQGPPGERPQGGAQGGEDCALAVPQPAEDEVWGLPRNPACRQGLKAVSVPFLVLLTQQKDYANSPWVTKIRSALLLSEPQACLNQVQQGCGG